VRHSGLGPFEPRPVLAGGLRNPCLRSVLGLTATVRYSSCLLDAVRWGGWRCSDPKMSGRDPVVLEKREREIGGLEGRRDA
jgi:hypothetical protein